MNLTSTTPDPPYFPRQRTPSSSRQLMLGSSETGSFRWTKRQRESRGVTWSMRRYCVALRHVHINEIACGCTRSEADSIIQDYSGFDNENRGNFKILIFTSLPFQALHWSQDQDTHTIPPVTLPRTYTLLHANLF